MRPLAAACLAALALVLVAAGGASAEVRLAPVGDFASPVHVTGAPGDDERLYVVEQQGIIRVVGDGASSVFADLTGPVEDAGDEQGLLSMAFAPDFETSRLLYVFFTNENGGSLEIAELRAPTGDAVDPSSLRPVIEIEHSEAGNHNGGQLQFGPDGYLYASTGDGGNGYDEPNDDAASTTSLLGKILRIDPHGTTAGEHTVPADNPFGNEVWAYGLRNPWRFSFDGETGDLVIGDVGQNAVEEVDYVPASAGAGRGAFFGWDECEGNLDANPSPTGSDPCTLQGDVRPAVALMQSHGFCSVIGGYVVHDPTLPSLLGRYVYGDLCGGRLRSVLLDAAGASDDGEVDGPVSISSPTSFGEDAAGCLYVASRAGGVYRVVEEDTSIPCPLPPDDDGEPGPRPPGGGGGPGGSETGGGGGTGSIDDTDVTAPHMFTSVKRRQRVLRLGGAVVHASCDEICSIAAGGWLRIGRRIHRLRRTVQGAQVTAANRIKVRLTRRGRRALRQALERGRPIRIRVGLRACDAAGNPSPLRRFTVGVRR